MNLLNIKDKIQAETTRFYSLKTNKAKERSRKAIRALKTEALDILFKQRDAYARHSIKTTVKRWYEGCEDILVETPYGLQWINITCDENSKSWYASTCCVEYSQGQSVIVEFDVEVDLERIYIVAVPKRVYGGTLNRTKYAELCKQGNLAFFKYPDGHMSGLFAKGAI